MNDTDSSNIGRSFVERFRRTFVPWVGVEGFDSDSCITADEDPAPFSSANGDSESEG